MRKIRKFKMDVRVRELVRRSKRAKLDLAAAGLADEPELTAFGTWLQKSLQPAVVYQSFPSGDPLGRLAPMEGLGFSLGIATLGLGPESAAAGLPEPRAQAARLAEQIALEDAVAFVLSLLQQEAKEENCDLSPIEYLREPGPLEAAAVGLQAEKIGVKLEGGSLSPRATAAFGVSWIARPRSGRSGKPAKK